MSIEDPGCSEDEWTDSYVRERLVLMRAERDQLVKRVEELEDLVLGWHEFHGGTWIGHLDKGSKALRIEACAIATRRAGRAS